MSAPWLCMGVQPNEVIFIEDTPINTKPAKAMGMTTILVDHPPTEDADFCVPLLMDVQPVIEQLIQHA